MNRDSLSRLEEVLERRRLWAIHTDSDTDTDSDNEWRPDNREKPRAEDLRNWHRAVHNGDQSEVIRLAKAGVDLNDSTRLPTQDQPKTGVTRAIDTGSIEMLRLLYELGADVHLVDNRGRGAFYRAVNAENTEIMRILVDDFGVDPNRGCSVPPLLLATRTNNEPMVRLLLERYEADVNHADYGGRTPLYWAAHCGNEHMARMLIEEFDANVNPPPAPRFGSKYAPIFEAARGSHPSVVTALVAHGARVPVGWLDYLTVEHWDAINAGLRERDTLTSRARQGWAYKSLDPFMAERGLIDMVGEFAFPTPDDWASGRAYF